MRKETEMTACYLNQDLLGANRRELSRRVERRAPAPEAEAVVIRLAGGRDRDPLVRLAALDCAPRLAGDVLLAEVAGEIRAALELASGRMIADPFRPTAELKDLLVHRARTLGRPPAGGGLRGLGRRALAHGAY
jgi:hypothetical protein